MRNLQRTLWAAAISTFLASGAFAQTTTGTTGTTGSTTTGSTGATTRTGTGGTGTTGGMSSLDLATQQAPTITAPSQSNSTNSALQPSNAFNKYYANPYYQGRAGATTGGTAGSSANTPGGFGAPLYTTTGAGGANTGSARNTTGGGTARTGGATGTTSGFGGTSGTANSFGAGGTGGTGARTTGGFGGATGATGTTGGRAGQAGFGGGNSSNQQNNGLSTGRQIAYTATLKFAAPSIPVAQMQTDLRDIIDASNSIANARGVNVTAGTGGVVVLEGNAKDEDEARLIEGMIRLTPGVKDVKNELKYPVQ